MLIVHKDSHIHADLTEAHVKWALNKFKDQPTFFKTTVEMPKSLPALDNALYGPAAGDPPVAEADVVYIHRPGGKSRLGKSRMVRRPMRKTRAITVIAGPHDGHPMVVYAMHGGYAAEREPFDEDISSPAQQTAANAFWAEHALATGEATPTRHRTRANSTMTDSVNAPRHVATVLGGGLHDQGAWVLLRVSPAYKGHRFVIASGSEGYYPDGEVAVFPADVNSRITGNILAGPFRGDTRLWRVLPKMLGFDITPNTPE